MRANRARAVSSVLPCRHKMAKKILIIDDEKDLVAVTKLRLEANGFTVSEAFTVKEGLARIAKEKPDLILLDIMLPDGNGYQVCQDLKSKPETRDILIVIFTASSLRGLASKAVEAGAEGYVIKPFEPQELLGKVNQALGGR